MKKCLLFVVLIIFPAAVSICGDENTPSPRKTELTINGHNGTKLLTFDGGVNFWSHYDDSRKKMIIDMNCTNGSFTYFEGLSNVTKSSKTDQKNNNSSQCKQILIGGIAGAVVFTIAEGIVYTWRYQRNAHAKGEKTVFDRLFAKLKRDTQAA